MHESQGVFVVLFGFILVFTLSAIQLATVHWIFSAIEFSAPKSIDVGTKLLVIVLAILEAGWICNRIPIKGKGQ